MSDYELTVVPAKVTVVLGFTFVRSSWLPAGTAILLSVIAVHEATAAET